MEAFNKKEALLDYYITLLNFSYKYIAIGLEKEWMEIGSIQFSKHGLKDMVLKA